MTKWIPKAKREALQAKILSVMEAIGHPITAQELIDHPLLNAEKLNPHSAGANFRALLAKKKIRRLSGKRWAPLKSRTAVATPEPKELPKMYFVLVPSEQKILLDVGGMRLPVVIE
jgi:hypothetical protein